MQPPPPPQQPSADADADADEPVRRFTRLEVESHNNMNSAAIIIDNKVYNVTEFLEEHPGGAEVLLDNAGRDASQCFRDVGHSDIALEWRKQFLVGELVQDEWRPVAERTPLLDEPREQQTLGGLLDVWAPPALLALLAGTLYIYLF